MSIDAPGIMDNVVEPDYEPYRSISKAAVSSLVLALLALAGWYFAALLILAAAGGLLGVVGWMGIRRYPLELTGKPVAILGTLLSLGILVGGTAKHSIEYATEVPDGYERVSFYSLKSHSSDPRLDVPPPEALQLDGKKVFIKGYMYPDDKQSKIKQFILVPDLGTCCFGGQPKLTHMVQVTLERQHPGLRYTMRKRKLAGTLRVDPSLKPVGGVGGVYYELIADIAQ